VQERAVNVTWPCTWAGSDGVRAARHARGEAYLLAKRLAREPALAHQLERPLCRADRAHAVVDAPRAESHLRNLEAASLAQQDVLLGHAAVVEANVHVPVRRVVVAHHAHRADDLESGRVGRHEDLRLPLVHGPIRVGLHHHDHDFAARIAGAANVKLLAVQHPLVSVEARLARDIFCVRRGEVRLGHRVSGTDLTCAHVADALVSRWAADGLHATLLGFMWASTHHSRVA
jgi:hypothetical protein